MKWFVSLLVLCSVSSASAQEVWSTLDVMPVVTPWVTNDNGATNHQAAIQDAIDALPSTGGIVYFGGGTTRKDAELVITKSHVKLWSVNRAHTLYQRTGGVANKQAITFRNVTGAGVFGLQLTSDAIARAAGLAENALSFDNADLVEVVGNDINGARAVGIMLYGTDGSYVEGNYVHYTWADHIHHTNAAANGYVWRNQVYSIDPVGWAGGDHRGDDGVAAVTYGYSAPRNHDLEWWGNVVLHSSWGRGFSVVGADRVNIHDNTAIGVAGAGVLVATECGYSSSASSDVTIKANRIYAAGHTIGHKGITVAGDCTASGAIVNVASTNNVSYGTPNGAYGAGGLLTNVTNTGLVTSETAGPPDLAPFAYSDTSVLRTRDTSHVASGQRPGLYRIHVRNTVAGFQQRFEYIVKGDPAAVFAWTTDRAVQGDYLSERRVVAGVGYALMLTAQPVTIPSNVTAVTFTDLRAGDLNGTLTWLWNRVDSGTY